MKLITTLFFLACGILISQAQKTTTQTIDASKITMLQIESDEVFKITMKTTKAETITIRTESEGEYFQNLSIITELTGQTLKISSKYPEIFTSGFDKLSAHKVFAVQLILEIPEDLKVSIISNVASVFGEGNYKSLQIELKSGQCLLNSFQGNLLVNTYRGNIKVRTINAKVEAESRHGTVTNTLKYSGKNLLKLKTIDGNITVTKSQ